MPQTLDSQLRILGAVLHSPSRFLPLVRPAESAFDSRIRSMLSLIRVDDDDDITPDLFFRAQGQLNEIIASLTNEQPGEFLADLATLYGRTSEAEIERAVLDLRRDQRSRAVTAILRASAAETQENPSEVDAALARLREQLDAADLAAPNRYRSAGITDAGLEAADLVKPPSLVGDGLISSAEYSVLYGQPGLGKSYLTLQLAESVARGETFFGLQTLKSRVGVISLEVPAYYVRERLRQIRRLDQQPTGDVLIFPADRLRGLTDLCSPREQGEISAVIRGEGIGLLVIDPLALAHRGRETQEDLSAVVSMLKEMPHRTGCAPLLVHHEPKEQTDKERSDLDALRGATILRDMAGCLMRLKTSRGRLCMCWPKVRHAPIPAHTWLQKAEESGKLCEIEEPLDKATIGRQNRDRIEAVLADGEWHSTEEICDRTGISRETVWRHLKKLKAEQRGSTHCSEWRLPIGPESDFVASQPSF